MKSVVLLSGGLDSALVLAMTAEPVEALTVDYGQRHQKEIDAAEKIAAHYGVPWRLITVDPQLYEGTGSALLGGSEVPEGHAEQVDATYVPMRNTLLISMASVRAEILGARMIGLGANADDAAGYPDCRPSYLEGFRDVLITGTLQHIWVHAPLLYTKKSQIRALAEERGVPTGLVWSCYAGGAEPCGKCGACQ